MEATSTGTILRCAAACASRGRPRRRRFCCFGRPRRRGSARLAPFPHSPDGAGLLPPPRRPAELGTRVLVGARRTPACPFVSPLWPLMMAPVCLVCQDDGRTALMVASVLGYEGCVRLLLDSGATEVNATSVSLERALTQAHAIGQLQCRDPLVSCLLSSEPRTVSSSWRGNQRPPRDRQASPRTRRGSDAPRQGRRHCPRRRTAV